MGGGSDEGGRRVVLGAGDDTAFVIDHIGRGEVAVGGLGLEQAAVVHRTGPEQRCGPVQVIGHGQDVAAQAIGLGVHIGAGDLGRVLHDSGHPLGEPVVHAAGDQGAEHDGHHDGGQEGGQGEQADETHVQPRPGVLGLLANQPDHAPAHRGGQGQDEHQVAQHHSQHGASGRSDGPGARRLRGEVDGRQGQQDRNGIAQAQHEARVQALPQVAQPAKRVDR